jgi:hypothetical protein
MAVSTFNLATNVVVDNTPVTGNGNFEIWSSGIQANTQGMNAIKAICKFDQMTPDPEGNIPTTYSLVMLIESSNDNGTTWFPLVMQFDPLRNPVQGPTVILQAAPNIFNPDEGISFDDWNGIQVVSRTSRRQDTLGALFRVRVLANEFGYGGPGAFQSVRLSISGERSDV